LNGYKLFQLQDVIVNFRPCIDLHGGQVKQIVGSTLSDDHGADENFVSDKGAAYYAELYKRDGLTGGHVIMLGPGNQEAACEAVKAYPDGLQVGGGINDENALEWLQNGASHVILTSYIFKDGKLKEDNLLKIFSLVGKERLVLDLSCRLKDGKYYIVTDRWQKFTEWEVNRESLEYFAQYCCEFLIHAVDVEGMQSGIDTDLISLMAENSPIPCVYAGGISTMDDIAAIETLGKGRIGYTVGSALDIFGGTKLSYSEVVARG